MIWAVSMRIQLSDGIFEGRRGGNGVKQAVVEIVSGARCGTP
jgi:hypothetical protein